MTPIQFITFLKLTFEAPKISYIYNEIILISQGYKVLNILFNQQNFHSRWHR